MNYVHKLATEYRDAGISVIPLRMDGSKEPLSHLLPQVCKIRTRDQSGTWDQYKYRLAIDEELAKWFKTPIGIGMVGGAISGGLEIIDFDDGSLFQPWWDMVRAIVERLPVVETPSGGWHVLFRCNEIAGNTKIAMAPKREKKTLIETRGEGGYIVAEGSPCETHATGLPYAQYSGPSLPEIPRITPDERRQLWAAARTFDLAELSKAILRKQRANNTTITAKDVHPVIISFCHRLTWDGLLTRHGWTTRDGVIWTRPGKSFGTSAKLVTAQDGTSVLTVFSGNAGPLSPTESHKSWSLWWAYVALEFGGDGKAAFAAAKQEVAA